MKKKQAKIEALYYVIAGCDNLEASGAGYTSFSEKEADKIHREIKEIRDGLYRRLVRLGGKEVWAEAQRRYEEND